MQAERKSTLVRDGNIKSIDFRNLESNWLLRLVRMLGHHDVTRAFENIAFISFNYDRTLEHFLYYSVMALHALSEADAAALISNVPIYHPYGTVGKLQWQGGDVEFGAQFPDPLFPVLAGSLRTYTEEVRAKTDLEKMHDELMNAETLVFLGFAYHEQNIRLLTPQEGLLRNNLYGTAFGISGADIDAVKKMLDDMYDRDIPATGSREEAMNIFAFTCDRLMDNYALTLPRI